MRRISQGLKPHLLSACNVRAEARTYLRGKGMRLGSKGMRLGSKGMKLGSKGLKSVFLACAVFMTASLAQASTYYVTVAGLGGEPDYEQRFTANAMDLDKIFKSAVGA